MMDCKYIQERDLHAAYLMGRLEELKKKEYEVHLKNCPRCREEQEKERRLTAALKEAGREEMKAEIRRQVEARKSAKKEFDWTVVLKAAAVLFFLITIPALYYYSQHTKQPLTDSRTFSVKAKDEIKTFPEGEYDVSDNEMKKNETKIELRSGQPGIAALSIDESLSVFSKGGGADKNNKIDLARKQKKEIALPAREPIVSSVPLQQEMEGRIKKDGASGSVTTPPVHSAEKRINDVEIYPFAGMVQRNDQIPGVSEPSGFIESGEIRRPPGAMSEYSKSQSGKEEMGRSELKIMEQKHLAVSSAGLLFSSGKKRMEIYLIEDSGVLPDEKSGLPLSFEITMEERDSLHRVMKWQVNKKFTEIDPSEMTIRIVEGKTLQVSVGGRWSYVAELDGRTTRAVLRKK